MSPFPFHSPRFHGDSIGYRGPETLGKLVTKGSLPGAAGYRHAARTVRISFRKATRLSNFVVWAMAPRRNGEIRCPWEKTATATTTVVLLVGSSLRERLEKEKERERGREVRKVRKEGRKQRVYKGYCGQHRFVDRILSGARGWTVRARSTTSCTAEP